MILGFTGTQKGMTRRQHEKVRYLFGKLRLTGLHHGDCVGADAEAHKLAIAHRASIVIHPPSDPKLRAYCIRAVDIDPGRYEVWEPKAYLARNRDIVTAAVDGLIAAPRGFIEQPRGSGTWATVRYARKAERRIWIVFPDGTFKEEQHPFAGFCYIDHATGESDHMNAHIRTACCNKGKR